MGCYYTLCHNTYAYSLLFYKVYIKRENVGSWNSGLEKEQILETSKSPETPRKLFLEIIKNTERRKYQRGPTPWARGWGARPTPLGVPPYLVAASWTLLTCSRRQHLSPRGSTRRARGRGRPHSPGCALHPCGWLVAPSGTFFAQYFLYIPKLYFMEF